LQARPSLRTSHEFAHPTEERISPEQILATYDAANLPKRRIRKGILFTADRLPGIFA